MKTIHVHLRPLEETDRESFIKDNQEAFRYGAIEEFGVRDEHFEEPGEIISRATIERCLDDDGAEAYRIFDGEETVGGVVLKINAQTHRNELVLLFVAPAAHSRGIGYAAWCAVEKLHPETEVWETCTPYFEKRNIHFYINKCGFRATAFWNRYYKPPLQTPEDDPDEDDEMFFFEKVMR